MKKNGVLVLFSLIVCSLFAQNSVSQKKMEEVYEKIKTPYKYGLVLAPETNNYKMDCPTVFRQGDKWYMTFVIYNGRSGNDGRGYETWLAESDNLLEWKTKGRILSFRNGTWDTNQRGGFPALPDMEWGGSYALQPYKGNYWMTYIGGANAGYEAGPLRIGMAWTKEKNLGEAVEWESMDKPLLSSEDKDAQWFENLTQYKSTVYWDKKKTLGYPFVMFYNAGGRHPQTQLKGERIGIALSKDMKKWKRYAGNPVFSHETQGTITGDAQIQKMGDVYVMFYFSAFAPSRQYKAFNTFACSYDLIHWTDWTGDDLIIPSKNYDNLFAHKSCVINHDGVVYHFYCGVNKDDQRGIAVATSKPMGRSAVRFPQPEEKNRRTVLQLDKNWKTTLLLDQEKKKLTDKVLPSSFTKSELWQIVNIPHNWDDYYGYRQLTHGNLHATALYKKSFTAPKAQAGKRYFLHFEGVGTYATITLNGKSYGRHPVGRTTLTLDVTDALKPGEDNLLEVKAEHPEMISDMPWVCGGCSSEWGFSEGSQPLGIFRPVVLEVTDEVRIEPFGVHIWNDDKAKTVYVETEVKNYSSQTEKIQVVNKLNNADGLKVFLLVEEVTLAPGETKIIRQSAVVENPILWSVENPYLYNLASMIKRGTATTDEITTPFGIRTISWPVKRKDGDGRFYLNGKSVFINGVCEYEHQFGQSHAFSKEQVAARVKQIKAAGFNAFRDAHQPHHLDYQKYWDEDGILFWTQFSAHVWYDTPEFRANFKQLLRQWVKERRNSPSVVMWGLQNESVLPREFAEECSAIIREMDPTAQSMRVITTCNGGEGTDWDVVQNWSGTYGGKPENYKAELAQSDQLLNGEYGAWRSIDLHTEPGTFEQNGVWSEDRMCQLMEMKIRLAEQAKDSVCGQFQWIFSSHDNPGRRQPDEAYRKIDKVGPFNYKGLVTPWEEPLDVYYMYRANYVPAAKDPMVYLVSHTWPDRFATGRRRTTVEAYSNCDSVLLYNDATNTSLLGRKKNNGIGTHFMWEHRDVRYNVLRAVGYYKGKPVAEDVLVLNGLERASHFDALYKDVKPLLKAESGHDYLYRINCGGDSYTDEFGQVWAQDNTAVSHSWAQDFEGLSPYLASQRMTNDPIKGTRDWSLFQHFRFGRHKLFYDFPVPDGTYRVEFYFIEPWHGTGGSEKTDCEGLRIFDVAVNGKTVLNDLDIWAEAGHDVALKKVVTAEVKGGKLEISFPEVKAGQAVISAIAVARISSAKSGSDNSVGRIVMNNSTWSWAKANTDTIARTPKELLPEDKNARSTVTYEAEKAKIQGAYKKIEHRKQTGISFNKVGNGSIEWNISTGLAQVYALRFKYMNTSGKLITVRLKFVAANGTVLKDDEIAFPEAPEKWKLMSTTTGTYINAGHYKVILSSADMNGLWLDALDVQ
ncbi:beta-d-glucuronidase/beta-L-arabinofuranosidase [Bacteroides ihuae]|uniref:beta-d-glucuronidase/beta-L-arabinofuranosidase n=1 Tax=Bacteroides ihuae TaxID=1852362 RepID=UPI0008DAB33F|nr:malectin domain-containing carbohydrate-binding protein [Bacteroides ihuae]